MTRDETSAAILAGGRARRLGGLDKSRLVVDGQPIIVRQLSVLQLVARDVFVVAPDAARFADLDVQVFPDVVPGAGAIGGILTALESADTPLVVVVACDMPFLQADVLVRLAELTDRADAAWVVRERGAEPLVACYRKSCASRIRSAIEAGNLKAANLDRVLQIAAMPESEIARFGAPERILANVNTPEDYARIEYRVS